MADHATTPTDGTVSAGDGALAGGQLHPHHTTPAPTLQVEKLTDLETTLHDAQVRPNGTGPGYGETANGQHFRLLTADDITVAVETDRPPLELPAAPFGALEQRIAHHLGDLIGDRATLQMGIGSVPEAIMSMLADRRELGIHSGMVGDSAMTLMQSGAVTNAHKGMDAGVTVSGVLFGTRKLYDYAARNPCIRLHPTSYTHHIGVLGRLKNFVSINSALEVDLTGQINAEAIGGDHIGAVGGQVDYIRAAALSEGGVSIVALPASGKGGDSKIVSRLSGPVTTARSDVDVVATEHGVAHLRGRSLRQRVRALVQIAAPEHRERLLAEARQILGESV